MTTTPAPGDLKARLLAMAAEMRKPGMATMDDCEAWALQLDKTIAALSALPAGGVPREMLSDLDWAVRELDAENLPNCAAAVRRVREYLTPYQSAALPAGSSRDEKACADAWLAVCSLLDELAPNWINTTAVGREAALATIRRLATPAPVAASGEDGGKVASLAERRALNKALDALDQLSEAWAEEVNLTALCANLAKAADVPAAIYAMVVQAWVEGAYAGRMSHGMVCPECRGPQLLYECVGCSATNYPPADATTPPPAAVHPDDLAVDRFAAAMKVKLAKKRADGRGGWDDPKQCSVELLSSLLHEHVAKGDPVDVGNLAMMLHQRGSGVLPPPAAVGAQGDGATEHVRRQVGRLAQWLLRMSHNESYFGEPPGLVKSVTEELVHAVDPIYPPIEPEPDPLAGVTIHTATVPLSAAPAAGKGVDDAMVERAIVAGCATRPGEYPPNWPDDYSDDEQAHGRAFMAAALRAALKGEGRS